MPDTGRLRLLRSLVAAFLPDYLRLVEPDAAEHLLLEHVRLLELPEAPAGTRDQGLGLAAEATDDQGAPVTFLIRIESTLSSQADLESFLARCLGSLGAQYGQAVLFHVLGASGSRPGINLEMTVVSRVCGLESLRIFYSRFGLQHARAEHYLDSPLPPAWALCTWMSPVRCQPAEVLEAVRRRIAAAGLPEEQRDLLLAVAEAGASPP